MADRETGDGERQEGGPFDALDYLEIAAMDDARANALDQGTVRIAANTVRAALRARAGGAPEASEPVAWLVERGAFGSGFTVFYEDEHDAQERAARDAKHLAHPRCPLIPEARMTFVRAHWIKCGQVGWNVQPGQGLPGAPDGDEQMSRHPATCERHPLHSVGPNGCPLCKPADATTTLDLAVELRWLETNVAAYFDQGGPDPLTDVAERVRALVRALQAAPTSAGQQPVGYMTEKDIRVLAMMNEGDRSDWGWVPVFPRSEGQPGMMALYATGSPEATKEPKP